MDTKITPGCLLTILVDDEPDISRPYVVDEKGCVTLAISDTSGEHVERWDVSVKGLTTTAAKAAITESLSKYFKNPDVHVALTRIPGLRVEITGEVQRPGAYVLPFNSRVSDLFAVALTKPMADLTNVLIRRVDHQLKTPGGAASFNVDFTTGAADDSDDPKLEDGDKLFIRKLAEAPVPAELQIVRVVGEISAPPRDVVNGVVQQADGVAVPISKGMKLKDVLERIGGLKETADKAHLYLGRMDGLTRILDGDKVDADDPENNLVMKAGDLLIVPRRDRSQVFAVLGEVNAPNTFELKPGAKVRVMQAIALAGDFNKKADHHKAVLSRGYLLDPSKARAIPFDPELVKKGQQPDMELESGDAVFIEQRRKRPTIWQQLLPLALHFLPF
jgi:protein involved in polysaccharide export with SLBB domain